MVSITWNISEQLLHNTTLWKVFVKWPQRQHMLGPWLPWSPAYLVRKTLDHVQIVQDKKPGPLRTFCSVTLISFCSCLEWLESIQINPKFLEDTRFLLLNYTDQLLAHPILKVNAVKLHFKMLWNWTKKLLSKCCGSAIQVSNCLLTLGK